MLNILLLTFTNNNINLVAPYITYKNVTRIPWSKSNTSNTTQQHFLHTKTHLVPLRAQNIFALIHKYIDTVIRHPGAIDINILIWTGILFIDVPTSTTILMWITIITDAASRSILNIICHTGSQHVNHIFYYTQVWALYVPLSSTSLFVRVLGAALSINYIGDGLIKSYSSGWIKFKIRTLSREYSAAYGVRSFKLDMWFVFKYTIYTHPHISTLNRSFYCHNSNYRVVRGAHQSRFSLTRDWMSSMFAAYVAG